MSETIVLKEVKALEEVQMVVEGLVVKTEY